MFCKCEDWEIGTSIINNAIFLVKNHGGGEYAGPVFVYCPWCGEKLEEKELNA